MPTTFTALPGPGVQLMSATPGPDLAAAGYVEQEYVARGRALRYLADTLPADGRVAATVAEEAEFATRVLVRRPATPGPVTVVLEWLNVSSGDDAAPDYTYLAEEILRRGHVWVGVSAQYVGVEGGRAVVPAGEAAPANGLKARDPERYGALNHPGDAFCYGIFTAVADALADPGPPLDGFEVTRRIAVGESQSAFALTTYVNAVQPLTGCFDGFLVHSRGSAPLPLGEPGTGIDLDRVRHLPASVLRDDVSVPVIVLETETDVLSPRLHFWQARQPDAPFLRVWEVAGSAHADRWQIGDFEEFLGCPDPVNTGQQAYVARAALRWLETWSGGGTAAPSAAPLDLHPDDDPAAPERFALDTVGNATGGVRTPCVDAPTQVLTGLAAPGVSIICSLFGRTLPIAADVLRDQYDDPADYLARYDAALAAAIEAGFVLPEDAAAIRAEARPDLIR